MVPDCSIKTARSESQTLSNVTQEQVPFNSPLLSNSYKEQINPSHVSYEVKRALIKPLQIVVCVYNHSNTVLCDCIVI